MPEGDTVHLAARRLRAAIEGSDIVRTDFRVPSLATTDLGGLTVESVVARGKHLFFRFGGDVILHSHFKMEGSWHLYRPGERWRGPGADVRAVLETERFHVVGFRLPVIELMTAAQEADLVGRLGPDALAPDPPGDAEGWAWDPHEALRRLRARAATPIGDALLDQRVISGLGNVYRNEICFLAGVHPSAPVSALADVGKVVSLSRRTMLANRDTARHVTTGSLSRGREHWVYGRRGKPCYRCGAAIQKEVAGPMGAERSTYWCPTCQPKALD